MNSLNDNLITNPRVMQDESILSAVANPSRRELLRQAMAAAGIYTLSSLLPEEAFAKGGELVIALPNNPSTFDPCNTANHDAMVVTQLIFENLVGVDVDGNVVPQLAKALPRITNDGKTYVFELREGVSFQNGQPFTAEDVKYSFDYVLDPKNNALRRPLFNRISDVIVESKNRVRIELRESYRPMLEYMQKYMGIFPVGSREKYNSDYFKSTPIGIGTGPATFVEWKQNDRVVLAKNPNYWRKGVPDWDKVTVRIIPDDAARLAYLLTGNVDITSAPNPKDFEMLQSKKGIGTGKRLSPGCWFFLVLNNKKPPFDDVNVRRAIATGIDRDMLAQKVFYGMVHASSIPAPNSAWWYDKSADEVNQYNKARAKEFVEKSKYRNSAEFEMLVPSTPYLIDVKDAAVVIQAELAEIGIRANIKEMEQGILLQQIRLGNHISALQVAMGPPEPTYMTDLFCGKDNVFSKSAGYGTADFWNLLGETYHSSDQATLKPIFAKIYKQLALDSPHIWLGFVNVSNAWKSDVHGFKVNQGLTMRVADVSKA